MVLEKVIEKNYLISEVISRFQKSKSQVGESDTVNMLSHAKAVFDQYQALPDQAKQDYLNKMKEELANIRASVADEAKENEEIFRNSKTTDQAYLIGSLYLPILKGNCSISS